MASLRKDTAAGRAAIAKRRQRVTSYASEHSRSVPLEEPRLTPQGSDETIPSSTSRRHFAHPSSEPTLPTRRPESAHTASKRVNTSKALNGYDTLLEQSNQVANEAASVLASVRKTDRPAAPPRPDYVSRGNVSGPQPGVFSFQETKTIVMNENKIQQADSKDEGQPVIEQEEDEEKTIEDLEPLVFDADIDSSCLPWSSNIRIQANIASIALHVQKKSEDSASGVAHSKPQLLQANGLGRDGEQVLRLLPVAAVPRRPVLCYGDSITLRSSVAKDTALACRSIAKDDGVVVIRNQLGFFQSAVGMAGQWTVIRALSDGVVRVGSLALENKADSVPKGPTAPVRSGDAILLRNRENGGLLALVHGKLQLVTDSYNSDQVRNGSKMDPSLHGRLQRHEKLVPSAAETFHFILSNVPPAPLWLNARGSTERVFLHGSYLLDAERNQIDPTLDRSLFGEASRLGLVMDHHDRLGAIHMEQMQTPKGQEQALLDEILGSLLGLEGQYIRTKVNTYVLKEKGVEDLELQLVNSSDIVFNVSLRSLVEEVLPLATDFGRVRHFVSSHFPGYEYGNVMQSLCETLDRLLQEYVVFIAGLEQQYRHGGMGGGPSFTLRELQVLIQPSAHAMAVLRRVIKDIRGKKGGALINSLRTLKVHEFNGDAAADRVLDILLDNASVPYMYMLQKWLEGGVLVDPSGEFMIEFDEEKTWDERYRLRLEHVLEGFFSTKLTVERVLATGRFWNALQACYDADTSPIKNPDEPTAAAVILRYTASAARVASFIQTKYHQASRSLVRLLLDDYNLIGSLRLMKRYFLLDQGDFFVNFLDAAEDELLKELPHVSRGRIQHWLGVSVQLTEHRGEEGLVSSSSRQDRLRARQLNPKHLRCRFAHESLMDHLDQMHSATGGIDTNEPPTPLRHAYGGMSTEGITGLDTFLVEFPSIPFPVSLVLSQEATSSYQLLFRNLFFAKNVERRLVGIWQDHQAMKELQSLRGSLGPTFLLRQRMLHFLQNLIYYMMFEVIEPNWLELEGAIASPSARKEQTVDDILELHTQFLHHTLEACLLTSRDLVRALTKLMTTCLLFTDQMKRFMKATLIEEDQRNVAIEKQKLVQRGLNDRGGLRPAMSRNLLRENIERDRAERQRRVEQQVARVEREVSSDSYQKMIVRFEEVFSDNLREFMLQLTETDDLYHMHKVNLCIRLDYNGYVTNAMGISK